MSAESQGTAPKGARGGGTVRMMPNGAEGFANQCEPRAFTGIDVGPFFIHEDVSDDGMLAVADDMANCGWWHVTHIASGRAVQKGIPSKERALWLANKLLAFDVWAGDTKASILANIPPEVVTQIKVLRMDAAHGDCQGQIQDDAALAKAGGES